MSADSATASGRCASAMSKASDRRGGFDRTPADGAAIIRPPRRVWIRNQVAQVVRRSFVIACRTHFRGDAPVRSELTQRRKENLSGRQKRPIFRICIGEIEGRGRKESLSRVCVSRGNGAADGFA
jgi:hypothetical protein